MSPSPLKAVKLAAQDFISLAREEAGDGHWRGLTQAKMALLVGWSQSALSTRESGSRPIHIVHLAEVCEATGRSLPLALAAIGRAAAVPAYATMTAWDRRHAFKRCMDEMAVHVGQLELPGSGEAAENA